MSTFRIVNLTSQLGKRDANYNSPLKVDYVDGMDRKTLVIGPDQTAYLTVPSMPISLHRMRIKGWVKVDEISKKELKKEMDAEKKVNKPAPKKITTTTTTKKKRTYSKKTSTPTEKSAKTKE